MFKDQNDTFILNSISIGRAGIVDKVVPRDSHRDGERPQRPKRKMNQTQPITPFQSSSLILFRFEFPFGTSVKSTPAFAASCLAPAHPKPKLLLRSSSKGQSIYKSVTRIAGFACLRSTKLLCSECDNKVSLLMKPGVASRRSSLGCPNSLTVLIGSIRTLSSHFTKILGSDGIIFLYFTIDQFGDESTAFLQHQVGETHICEPFGISIV
jgi:hypothetical protein